MAALNLNCPKCSSADTQKSTLVMNKGGMLEKGARFYASYGINFLLPFFTILAAIGFGMVFALFSTVLGVLVFAGIIFAGFALRNFFTGKTKSKYADLPAQMKQNGFQCNRCEHTFVPAA